MKGKTFMVEEGGGGREEGKEEEEEEPGEGGDGGSGGCWWWRWRVDGGKEVPGRMKGNRKKRVLPSGGSLYSSSLLLSPSPFVFPFPFLFFLLSLFRISESSVSRTGTVAGLSGTGPD